MQAHLRSGNAQIDDVDEDSLTAMHHAARYDRVNVLEALIEARAGKCSRMNSYKVVTLTSDYLGCVTMMIVQFLLEPSGLNR